MAANRDLSETQVNEFFTSLSNWGKWGQDDQLGALNYITPQKRSQAAALIQDGQAVSMSLPLATEPGPDNPTPVMHLMMQTGSKEESSAAPIPYSADYFAIAPHGLANTHLDALCHVFHKGQMYNGYPSEDVGAKGAQNGAIDALKDGIVSRGVLIDIPRLKGKDWLEPGEEITPADLDRAEQAGGFRVESGDVLFVRTGRHARLKATGPWDSFNEGMAGLGAACLPWLHAREVAAMAGDGASDVLPSGYEKLLLPIHAVTIVAMGLHLIDNCDLEAVAQACAQRSRWTFLSVIAPLVLAKGTASPVNPLAVF